MLSGIRAEHLQRDVIALVAFGTRHVLSATDQPQRGTGAARDWLERQFQAMVQSSGGRLKVQRETFRRPASRLRREVDLVNVVATLPGIGDASRVYVVGGHYDSRNGDGADGRADAPGADDDASGTAAVLAACRVMCRHRFAATIHFVCYDGEEQGLLGSTAHAEALAKAGVRVDGMITNDIVGNTLGMDGKRRRDYLRCFSYAAFGNDSDGRSLARAASYAAHRHVDGLRVELVYRGDRYGRGGDHNPFFKQGFPAVRFTEPREDYSRQHQNVRPRDGKPYGDLPEFMDFDYLARVTSVNVALLAQLASAPPPPDRLAVRSSQTAYDTTLVWPAVTGAKGYEAVWRKTTAADWESSAMLEPRSTRRGLTAVLTGVCLDDVVVGVRSVGVDGSRSRVVTPPEPDAIHLRRARRRDR
ncbi:MAG: M20/M25/M40 family metallo-hydrolase [Planctomycetes bacterium]|nr:M20/M25/M40 family metallo-hydrolase [Planctomycetota bacterium]MCB9868882.1 M20/M25/M40 family metallo-hydrolase [Planctomycetota bacterium]